MDFKSVSRAQGYLRGFLFLLALVPFTARVQAQTQTWSSNPGSGDWNTAGNWTSAVPDSQSATAVFGASATTSVTLSAGVSLDTLQFNSGAPQYTINTNGQPLAFFGAGIVNNSSAAQSINNASLAQMNFYNSSSAGNAWIYSGFSSTVAFHNTSTAGSAWIDSNNNDNIFFNDSSTAGSATIMNLGNSNLTVNDDATLGNAVIINQATIDFAFQSGTGTLATAGNADITNTGDIYFDSRASSGNATITTNSGGAVYFYDPVAGAGQFAFNGTGFMDMSSLAGQAVTLGSLAGNGSVSLGSFDLAIGSNNLGTTFSGVIADGGRGGGTGGSVTKIGLGTLTLSGNNTYTGGTTVAGGTLVAGSASALGTGNVFVNTGALALSGPLTLNLHGNYTQSAGATLQIGVGPSTGQADQLNITGAATLAGDLDLAPYSNYRFHDNETLTVLDAASVNGTFGTVTQSVYGGSVSVVYNPTDVVLDVTADSASFQSLGTTFNQKNIGGTLDNLAGNGLDTGLINYLSTLSNSALPGAYDQLSPANLTPLYQMGFATAQAEAGLVGGRISQLFGNLDLNSGDLSWNGQGPMFAADMPAAQEAAISKDSQPQRWGVFLNGIGNFGTVTGDGNGPGYQYSTGGTAAGLDYRFSRDFVGGLLLGYVSSGTSQSTGTVTSTGGQLGLYAGWKQESLHIEALAAGGINSYNTNRNVLGGTALGTTQGQQYSGELSAGYDLKMDQAKLTPFLSGQYTSVALNAFTETGSLAPLSYGAQSEGYLSSDLGATASRKWDLGGGAALSPMVSAAWEHVYQGNLDSLAANFGSGPNFTVNGPATGKDAAVLGAGVNALLGKGLVAFVQYQGKVGLANYAEQNVSGGINLGF